MAGEELQLEARRFTTPAALAKEILHLLGDSDCKVIVLANERQWERVASELEGRVDADQVTVLIMLHEDELIG